jgi:flagellar motor protein MotB
MSWARDRMDRHAALSSSLLVAAGCVVATTGCTGNPFKTAASSPASGIVPPAVEVPGAAPVVNPAAPALPYAAPPTTASYGSATDTAALLESASQRNQLLEEEVTALREQLASTSGQLATALRSPPAAAPPTPTTADRVTSGGEVMRSAVSQLRLDGLPTRFDGSVVRVEIPADRLFETGQANLAPGAPAVLSTAADELERVFPGHYIGIEGHLDSSPLQADGDLSPHALSAARAEAVLSFLNQRTPLKDSQLFLVAHGSNHPVVSNATAAGRERNRRIELVIYPELAPR